MFRRQNHHKNQQLLRYQLRSNIDSFFSPINGMSNIWINLSDCVLVIRNSTCSCELCVYLFIYLFGIRCCIRSWYQIVFNSESLHYHVRSSPTSATEAKRDIPLLPYLIQYCICTTTIHHGTLFNLGTPGPDSTNFNQVTWLKIHDFKNPGKSENPVGPSIRHDCSVIIQQIYRRSSRSNDNFAGQLIIQLVYQF